MHNLGFKRLLGRVAIVTGAASGIGLAVSKKFLSEGAKVMMIDSNRLKLAEVSNLLKETVSDEITTMHGDITTEGFASDAVNSAAETFSTNCTILVNSAGILDNAYIFNMSEDMFDNVVNVNLKGTFLFSRAFLQHLGFNFADKKMWDIHKVNASIVNISSIAGKLGMFHQANYAASKSGVIGLTKTVCIELAKYGVRCNVVLPGFTDTPMIDPINNTDIFERIIKSNPMKRVCRPNEVANACLFLASDDSSYVNGSCLEVTGGLGA